MDLSVQTRYKIRNIDPSSNPDEAVYISYSVNNHGKGMNPKILPPWELWVNRKAD